MVDASAANWTAADVERLSAQGWRVELWKGQRLRMAPTGDVHGRLTWRLSSALDRYVEAHGLGQLWPAEAGFDLTRPNEAQQTVLAPDIAFVRAERVPPPVPGYAHVVPDLVVETASPTQSRQEMDGARRSSGWSAACRSCGWSGRRATRSTNGARATPPRAPWARTTR